MFVFSTAPIARGTGTGLSDGDPKGKWPGEAVSARRGCSSGHDAHVYLLSDGQVLPEAALRRDDDRKVRAYGLLHEPADRCCVVTSCTTHPRLRMTYMRAFPRRPSDT